MLCHYFKTMTSSVLQWHPLIIWPLNTCDQYNSAFVATREHSCPWYLEYLYKFKVQMFTVWQLRASIDHIPLTSIQPLRRSTISRLPSCRNALCFWTQHIQQQLQQCHTRNTVCTQIQQQPLQETLSQRLFKQGNQFEESVSVNGRWSQVTQNK